MHICMYAVAMYVCNMQVHTKCVYLMSMNVCNVHVCAQWVYMYAMKVYVHSMYICMLSTHMLAACTHVCNVHV